MGRSCRRALLSTHQAAASIMGTMLNTSSVLTKITSIAWCTPCVDSAANEPRISQENEIPVVTALGNSETQPPRCRPGRSEDSAPRQPLPRGRRPLERPLPILPGSQPGGDVRDVTSAIDNAFLIPKMEKSIDYLCKQCFNK